MRHLPWLIAVTLLLLSGRTVEGQGCSSFAVGISNKNKVKDSQFSASSTLHSDFRPWFARIGTPRGVGWCAKKNTGKKEFLEIDLERDYVFCGIRVQGGQAGHVDGFELEFALNKRDSFTPYGQVISRAHKDEEDSFFYNMVPYAWGRIVRFFIVKFTDFPCARIEMYGFPGPTISCGPEYMIAEFRKSYYPDLEASEMHLINTSCLSESETNTQITFHIPFKACGTTRVLTPDYLEYTNQVTRKITEGLISYKMDLYFPITCKYDRNETLDDIRLKVKGDDEETEEPTDTDGGQALHCSLGVLWLSAAVLYWTSVTER